MEKISTCFQLDFTFFIKLVLSKLFTLKAKHNNNQVSRNNGAIVLIQEHYICNTNTKLLRRAHKDKQRVYVVENGAGCPAGVCSYTFINAVGTVQLRD